MPENFELTHPAYDAVIRTYRRNADLYDGGSAMEDPARAACYLTRHNLEKDAQYAIRLRRAAYRNLAAPTVDLFASSVMDGVRREGVGDIPDLAPLLCGCDRLGGTPDTFFKEVVSRAAAVGCEFVLVDMPSSAEGAVTRKEARLQGLVPYFVRVPAENCIAWDFDPDGSLAWAAVREERIEAEDGPFSRYVTVKSVTVWEKTGWRRYASRDGSAFVPDGEGTLNIGRVPLIPFIYEKMTPMTGKSVIDDVASLILRVYNQDSELDKMLFDAALPILAAYGLSEEDETVLQKATSVLWRFGSPDVRLEYVEPKGDSFDAKRRQIQDAIESIREISLRQTKPRGAGVESAEAKRLDSVQIASQLAAFARSVAASERRCWETAGLLAGVEPSAMESVTVAYNTILDPASLRDKTDQLYLELRRNGDLSRATMLGRLGMTEEEIGAETERLARERKGA